MKKTIPINVSVSVNVDLKKAWEYWTLPEHITGWNFASPEWHCPRAENDLRPCGTFNIRMEARDGSEGFDFGGTYELIRDYNLIEYKIGDGRRVIVRFSGKGNETTIKEEFEPETLNSPELQRVGWQAILYNFK